MKTIRKTILEAAALLAVAVVVASAANARRGSGSIKWTKNYFDTGASLVEAQVSAVRSAEAVHDDGGWGTNGRPEAPAIGTRSEPTESAKTVAHLEHSFQSISFDEVAAVFEDPDTATGLNVFIDGRNEASYESGHLPGAIHADPYDIGPYVDELLAACSGAAKVIVYCNGGDCEDSIFMCRELVEAGVPYDIIYLYEGGWKEWEANDMPVEDGRP
jgi:rhodanese-related sulfurtransferase